MIPVYFCLCMCSPIVYLIFVSIIHFALYRSHPLCSFSKWIIMVSVPAYLLSTLPVMAPSQLQLPPPPPPPQWQWASSCKLLWRALGPSVLLSSLPHHRLQNNWAPASRWPSHLQVRQSSTWDLAAACPHPGHKAPVASQSCCLHQYSAWSSLFPHVTVDPLL